MGLLGPEGPTTHSRYETSPGLVQDGISGTFIPAPPLFFFRLLKIFVPALVLFLSGFLEIRIVAMGGWGGWGVILGHSDVSSVPLLSP